MYQVWRPTRLQLGCNLQGHHSWSPLWLQVYQTWRHTSLHFLSTSCEQVFQVRSETSLKKTRCPSTLPSLVREPIMYPVLIKFADRQQGYLNFPCHQCSVSRSNQVCTSLGQFNLYSIEHFVNCLMKTV